MNKKKLIGNVVFFTIFAIILIMTLYLVIGSAAAGSIMDAYTSLGNTSKDSSNKKMQFVYNYMKQTGNVKIATSLGLSRDDAQYLISQVQSNQDEEQQQGDQSNTSQDNEPTDHTIIIDDTPVSFSYNRTVESIRTNLRRRTPSVYFDLNNGFKITEINGTPYLVDVQGSGYYSSLYNDTAINGNGVDGVGCWMFAQVNAANALTGGNYCVMDALRARYPEMNFAWDDTSNRWVLMRDNGSIDLRTTVYCGQRGITQEAGVFAALGCRASEVAYRAMTASECYNAIHESGFNNCVYIVYGHQEGVLSSRNNHWLVVVGLTEDGFQFLGNGNRSSTITRNQIGNVSGRFTAIFKVERNR